MRLLRTQARYGEEAIGVKLPIGADRREDRREEEVLALKELKSLRAIMFSTALKTLFLNVCASLLGSLYKEGPSLVATHYLIFHKDTFVTTYN